MPFVFDNNAEDVEACIISIEAYGYILGERKYCFASYDTGIHNYDELAALLAAADNKMVKVIAKVKNDTIKDFKIDLNDLAERFQDKRFTKLSLAAWGLNNSSVIDRN